MRPLAAFLVGVTLFMGPAVALWLSYARSPAPVRHDYFPPPHLATDGRFRIVAFGSSSTYGHGASSPGATYPAQLQHLFDGGGAAPARIDVVNRGIDGEDVFSMLRRIDDDILPRRPDLVVWQLGTNDALHGIAPAEFGEYLRQGIARMAAAGVPLVLVGPQWNADPVRAALFTRMNAVMRAASRDNGLAMVDRFALMQDWLHDGRLAPTALMGADGLHMNDQGYAVMAKAVFDVVAPHVPARRERDGSAGQPSSDF